MQYQIVGPYTEIVDLFTKIVSFFEKGVFRASLPYRSEAVWGVQER